jgi:hypothetical protein
MCYAAVSKVTAKVGFCALLMISPLLGGCETRSSNAAMSGTDLEANSPMQSQAAVTTLNVHKPTATPLLADDGQATTATLRATADQHRPISSNEVIAWSLRGTRDEVIIDRIECSGTVFHLTASDELHLRDAGVSADVVRAMKATTAN